jgi:hypothetical protein
VKDAKEKEKALKMHDKNLIRNQLGVQALNKLNGNKANLVTKNHHKTP